MFHTVTAFIFFFLAVTSAFSSNKLLQRSKLEKVRSSSSTLFSLWHLNIQRLGKGYRNLQGDDSEVPVVPSVGEEVASKGTKKAFLKGPGLDERTCTIGSGPFSEDDLDSLPLLYKFHRQLTLLSQLEGTMPLLDMRNIGSNHLDLARKSHQQLSLAIDAFTISMPFTFISHLTSLQIYSKTRIESGNKWGGLEKIQRLKMANLEGIIPHDYSSNHIRAASVRDDKLLDDWNFDMNA